MTTTIAPTTNAGVEAEPAFDFLRTNPRSPFCTVPGTYLPKAPAPAAKESRKGAMA